MSEASYQLSVPIGTIDEKLILALAEMLPGILVNRLHYPVEKARAVAPDLARVMVMRARECDLLPHPDKAPQRLVGAMPKRERCEQLRRDLDAVVKIRYVEPAKLNSHQHGIIRRAAERLWELIPKGKFYAPEPTGPGGGGTRA